MPLSEEHQKELMKLLEIGEEELQARIQQLRREYTNDSKALLILDLYDSTSEIFQLRISYYLAVLRRDKRAARRLLSQTEDLLNKHYQLSKLS